MIRKLTLILLSLFTLFFTYPAYAAENWVIDNFQSQVNLQSDGKVQVTETIDADFGSLVKHGIYRDIPYIYPTDQGNNIYTDVQVQSILQDGSAANYQTSKEGNFLRLKIGDANRTISYKHTYQIMYFATGVLRSFEDHDELYWDVTGNGWPVPITQTSAIVTLPGGLIKATCFQGAFGSKNPCNMKLSPPTQASFVTTRPLQTSEGLTIVLGYKKGLVPIIQITPPPAYSTAPSSSSEAYPPNMPAFLITLLTLGGGVIWLWWKKGREQASGHEAIMVEYFPPNNLRPAEVGTLLDERADTLDVSATIIDLATRGFLTIKEEAKKWLFGSTDYVLSKTEKDESNLLPYEKHLLSRIFTDGDTAKVSELKTEFYDDLAKTKQDLYQDVVDKKFFPTNPEKVRGRYMAFALVTLILGFVGFFIGLFVSDVFSGVGLGTAIAGIMLLILHRSFSRRTTQGHELYRQILGFKLFIEKAEKYKQQFLERENIFNEVLPFAIVFGATEKFAKAFDVLGIKPTQPTWYYSSRPFNLILFSSNINNFSSSLTSAIAAQPTRNSFVSSGSGFSSGGGFSGGGFGGGGGGSW